jgi:hypothetical protein
MLWLLECAIFIYYLSIFKFLINNKISNFILKLFKINDTNDKKLIKTKLIDGNCLTSRNFILLYEIVDQAKPNQELLNKCFFIIEIISSDSFLNNNKHQTIFNSDDKLLTLN